MVGQGPGLESHALFVTTLEIIELADGHTECLLTHLPLFPDHFGEGFVVFGYRIIRC